MSANKELKRIIKLSGKSYYRIVMECGYHKNDTSRLKGFCDGRPGIKISFQRYNEIVEHLGYEIKLGRKKK